MNEWFKKQMRALAFATASVEKNTLNQISEEMGSTSGHHQKINHGSLMDNLQKGEITQEVKELRWRLYKVLDATKNKKATILGYDEFDNPIYNYTDKNTHKQELSKIRVDNYDDYPLEMVLDNTSETMGWLDVLDKKTIEEQPINKYVNEDGELVAIHNNINNEDYQSYNKNEKPIKIGRDFKPKFEIESYTKKLNIRRISETEKLLEFYISKYPDPHDKKTSFLISEIKRMLINDKFSDIIKIDDVGFMTYKTLGANDFEMYAYKILNFDKIIEHDGNYIIKFKSEVTLNGEYLLDKYRLSELDDRYANKEPKK